LLDGILKKKSIVFLSLIFLLLLDVKEYAFFVFALFYIIWILLDSKEQSLWGKLLKTFKQSFVLFLPSLIWMILMFTTSIIPVNMFLASVVGLLDKNFDYLLLHFNAEISTYNALEGSKSIPLINIVESWSQPIKILCEVVNVILSYIGKVLYPRVFSFLSVPKVVIFPVVYSSVLIIKEYISKRENKRRDLAILSLLILIWLLIYILRASHGRYLLPVVPAISVIYIFFLFKQQFTKKERCIVLVGTVIYSSLGYFFETTYIVQKVIIEILILILTTFILYKRNRKVYSSFLILFVSVVSFGTVLLFSYTQGQVYGYMSFGENRNSEYIASILPVKEKYWHNNNMNSHLISVLKEEQFLAPEWKWKLYKSLPKVNSLKVLEEKESFNFPLIRFKGFQKDLYDMDIEKVVLFVAEDNSIEYPYQNLLYIFFMQDWLELEDQKESKNIQIYIFKVIK
jgi:hypothetical protein